VDRFNPVQTAEQFNMLYVQSLLCACASAVVPLPQPHPTKGIFDDDVLAALEGAACDRTMIY